MNNDPTLPQSCRIKKPRASRKTRLFLPEEEDFNFSDSEDSSGSPERSDSAVECSSDDEGERSSEGSGSSSSESENDEDNNVNPFSCGFSGENDFEQKHGAVGGFISPSFLQSLGYRRRRRK